MSNVRRFPRRHDCYDEASRWIAKLDKGLSANEAEALQAWMAADVENVTVLRSMASVWDKMDCLSRLSDLFPVPARSERRFGGHALGLAASVFVAVAILILLAMDWFDIDWRVGLLAISIDALGPHPTARWIGHVRNGLGRERRIPSELKQPTPRLNREQRHLASAHDSCA